MGLSNASRLRRHRWVTLASLLALASGCVTPQKIVPHPAVKIPEVQFRNEISTLCLSNVASELGLEESDERMTKFAELVEEQLEALGFSVVQASDVDVIWEAVKEAGGGFYDPHTGAIDAKRSDVISEKFFREVKQVHSCDAVVYPSLVVVNAGVGGSAATWDHRQTTFNRIFSGYIPAISVRIVIKNAPDNEIYYGVGGIQLAQELKQDKFTDAHFVGIEADRFLEQWTDAEKGVSLALRDLASVMQVEKPAKEELRR